MKSSNFLLYYILYALYVLKATILTLFIHISFAFPHKNISQRVLCKKQTLYYVKNRLPRFREGTFIMQLIYSTVNTTLEASGETVPSAATARTSSL